MNELRLIFVYNAEGSLFGRLADFAHKMISPSTYGCNLCALTYGNFVIREEWRTFLESLPVECEFLYKEQFAGRYMVQADLPAVYAVTEGRVRELISSREINDCRNLEELKELVKMKVKNLKG
jgi:hypothetical protein